MTWFSDLTAKIFAGIAVFLLAVVLILLFWGWGKDGEIAELNKALETRRTELAECEAARTSQNAAIARAGAEAERQRKTFADALASGQQLVREAQGRVTIVRQSPPNGCPTSPAIRGADL